MKSQLYYLHSCNYFKWYWIGWNLRFCMCCTVLSHSVVPDSLWPHGLQPTRHSDKNTGVGCHAFLQGIFPTQGSNPGLPHCRQILYYLNHEGSSRLCMLLLLLSRFSHVRLCATPWMAAHQAPLSLGFSRQEHWSGLIFPSPIHESEKWKWSRSVLSDS